MDHEVWIRIRPCGKGCRDDIVLWSADWIGDDYPEEVDEYLRWDADDLSVEMHRDFDKKAYSPMVVVNVYNRAQEPSTVYVLEKLADYGAGVGAPKCRVFLDEGCAKAAMRGDYDAEMDSRDAGVDECGSYVTGVDARLRFLNGARIGWTIRAIMTEDNDYRQGAKNG